MVEGPENEVSTSQQNRPEYSLSPQYCPFSPSYLPDLPSTSQQNVPSAPTNVPWSPSNYGYSSPQYEPPSQDAPSTSQQYVPSGSRHVPTPPGYVPSSPNYGMPPPSQYEPVSPSDSPSSPTYRPSSPHYELSSQYAPRSPQYHYAPQQHVPTPPTQPQPPYRSIRKVVRPKRRRTYIRTWMSQDNFDSSDDSSESSSPEESSMRDSFVPPSRQIERPPRRRQFAMILDEGFEIRHYSRPDRRNLPKAPNLWSARVINAMDGPSEGGEIAYREVLSSERPVHQFDQEANSPADRIRDTVDDGWRRKKRKTKKRGIRHGKPLEISTRETTFVRDENVIPSKPRHAGLGQNSHLRLMEGNWIATLKCLNSENCTQRRWITHILLAMTEIYFRLKNEYSQFSKTMEALMRAMLIMKDVRQFV